MHPYLAGWIMSDGHNAGDRWVITQNIDDSAVLYEIQKMAGGQMSEQKRSKENGAFSNTTMVRLTKCGQKECQSLLEWGVPIGKKSLTVSFPGNKKDREIWLYLRGVFEGDGSISGEGEFERHPRVQVLSNRKWCEACRQFLEGKGISSFLHDDKRHPGMTSIVIRRRNSVFNFMEQIYRDKTVPCMQRKYSHWNKLKEKHPKIETPRCFLSRNEITEIASAIESGRTVKELSEKYRCHPNVLWRLKRQIDGGRKERTHALVEKAKRMLSAGHSVCDTCKTLGCSRKIIYKAKKAQEDCHVV